MDKEGDNDEVEDEEYEYRATHDCLGNRACLSKAAIRLSYLSAREVWVRA